jgi:UDP-N-acetylmuramyl pentapeptide phosphotransferase/UDP-N-acetylglucosamine-1-phosphate transferase
MTTINRHPAWWRLWLLLLVLGGLAFLDARATLSPAGHKVVEAGIVLLVYGLIWMWLRANEAAWLRELAGSEKDRDKDA